MYCKLNYRLYSKDLLNTVLYSASLKVLLPKDIQVGGLFFQEHDTYHLLYRVLHTSLYTELYTVVFNVLYNILNTLLYTIYSAYCTEHYTLHKLLSGRQKWLIVASYTLYWTLYTALYCTMLYTLNCTLYIINWNIWLQWTGSRKKSVPPGLGQLSQSLLHFVK